MSIQTLALCLLAAACASAPALAQNTVTDPDAAVPETRYQPAHVARAPVATGATPDQTWQENNRIVAGQVSHAGHSGHAGHAGHSKPISPAAPAAPAADPHAHHHGHQPQPDKKEHH